MTNTPPLTPCQVGLRCPNPETCDHKFTTPDGQTNRLHADDWFTEHPAEDDPNHDELELIASATDARAQWACKLDCPTEQRLACLQIGMKPGVTLLHGIFGSYTAPQRRAIARERDKKKAGPSTSQ